MPISAPTPRPNHEIRPLVLDTFITWDFTLCHFGCPKPQLCIPEEHFSGLSSIDISLPENETFTFRRYLRAWGSIPVSR